MKELKDIVSLCKRRGFIYPGSEIYGGFANTYSYGPYGVELKKNIKDLWWKFFVQNRKDMVGIDGPILMHHKTWQASGHLKDFSDAMIDCKECKARYRADHLIQNKLNIDVEGLDENAMTLLIKDNKIKCPKCASLEFTSVRYFNLMFKTKMNKVSNDTKADDVSYLRPETAQAIFLEFKNIINSMRIKLPFGIAQIGKAFRNEITPGNFIFRTIEFEQMEIEYFIKPGNFEEYFNKLLNDMHKWCALIGLKKNNLSTYEHPKNKLAHYSKKTIDILYDFPFGKNELYGLAYRYDFDLQQHQKFSNEKMLYLDTATNEKFIPHVIEPTFGLDRTLLALLCEAYEKETLENNDTRIVLKFLPQIAPIKAAIFPLVKKEVLIKKAILLYDSLKKHYNVEYDDSKSIGKRYRRQDELGTPWCFTIDYQTLEDNSITIRERDSMEQKRIDFDEAKNIMHKYIEA